MSWLFKSLKTNNLCFIVQKHLCLYPITPPPKDAYLVFVAGLFVIT